MKKQNSETDLKKAGIVSDAHGIRGEIYVIIFSGDNSWVNDLSELVLMPSQEKNSAPDKDSKLSFTIKKIKAFKKGFICSMVDVVDRNQAEELKKMEVWIPAETFISKDGEQPFLIELLNFEVTDQKLGLLGKVISFSSNGQQDLLVLDQKVNGQNVEIPFVRPLIETVDYKNKKIKTVLPEGLININEKD